MSVSPQLVAEAFRAACLAELEAIKPGNVHIFADGHGMRVEDFARSAEAAAAPLAMVEASVGERILSAIDATWQAVGCNTNLGIVLLCAPLARALQQGCGPDLRSRLRPVLQALTQKDAAQAFRAIVRASPAGLGESAQHDVHAAPSVTLLEAMREASGRDRIALQYASDYADIFELGVPRHAEAMRRWERPAWATTAVYLGFLATYDDTHIVRKLGATIAAEVREQAVIHERAFLAQENPKAYQRELLAFDADLKARGINPGTSADLTVATLFAIKLAELIADPLATEGPPPAAGNKVRQGWLIRLLDALGWGARDA